MEEKERPTAFSPLVSVAILTYQHACFIAEALESVLNQDYENIEIIVADDGSTDGTQNILTEYYEKFPSLIHLVLSESNRGISVNSNAALAKCTGKYVAWLGGDDVMFSSRISKQIEALEKNAHWAFAYSYLVVLDNETNRKIGMLPHSGASTQTMKASLKVIFGEQNPITAPSVTHHRIYIPDSGFSKFIPCASDWFFWAELCIVGAKNGAGCIGFIPEPLGIYRRHANNVTLKMMPDEFVTCAMLEYLYPQFWRHAMRARSRLFYKKAKIASEDASREGVSALLLFWAAVRCDLFFVRGWWRLCFMTAKVAIMSLTGKIRVVIGKRAAE